MPDVKNFTFCFCSLHPSPFLISFLFIKPYHLFCLLHSHTFELSFFVVVVSFLVQEKRAVGISQDFKPAHHKFCYNGNTEEPHFAKTVLNEESRRKSTTAQPWSIFPATTYWGKHCQDICRRVRRSGCSCKHITLTLRFSKNCKLNLHEPAAELPG